jgi:DNA-binding IclR family transcriptional regulator
MANGSMRTVQRAIDVLMAVAGGATSVTEVSEVTHLDPATTHRLLQGLQYESLVKKVGRGKYQAGSGLLTLARPHLASLPDLRSLWRDTLEQLRDLTGETVNVHARSGRNRICVDELQSEQVIRFTAGIGALGSLVLGAPGKAMLASLPEGEREELIRLAEIDPPQSAIPFDILKLRREVMAVQKQGYAVSYGERVADVTAVSVPILSPDGRVEIAITIAGPRVRFTDERIEGFRDSLLEICHALGRKIHRLGL